MSPESLLITPGEQKARAGDLAGAVVEYVEGYDYVTFVELMRFLEPYVEVRGTLELQLGPNIVAWAGMSEEFAGLIGGLLEEKRIFPAPASVLTYLIDGGMLKLPLAKRPPKKGYKSPRWVPVCLRTVAFSQDEGAA